MILKKHFSRQEHVKTRSRTEGQKVKTKKKKDNLRKIIKMARKFEGNIKNSEVLEVLNIDRKTDYKYCKLIKASG